MMEQDFYKLANRITSIDESYAQSEETLDSIAKKNYKQSVLSAVRKEKGRAKRKRFLTAAACFAVMAAATGIFHNEVQATVERIQYSLSTALGLGNDIARYREVLRTPVSNEGYTITLQEAVAAPEELLISYTVQREDGQPVNEAFSALSFHGTLAINGEEIDGSSGGSIRNLDEEGKIQGHETSYHLPGIDLSGENIYELEFTTLDEDIKGNWKFKFKADGSELYANTKGMELGDQFTLPNGTVVVLDELTVNDLEQRVTYHTSANDTARYMLQLHITDSQGRTIRFEVGAFGGGKGYMQNMATPESTWLTADAGTVTAALYSYELPENSGEISKDTMRQIGEAVAWDLKGLR